tara:strand:- start:266 stop:805 length:540 start_codon:yes stop_codon:yes gene_type:complete
MTTITLSTLAHKFNKQINLDGEMPDSFSVYYKNDSSVGNRYIRWQGVWAKLELGEGDNPIDKERLYNEVQYGTCEWRHLFTGLHHGLIVGPKTHAAVEECFEILRNDVPPEDDGTKVRHINHLGGVNMLDKPTFHEWELTAKLGKILSEAFFADRREKTLYSEDFVYIYKSHSGWNRSC